MQGVTNIHGYYLIAEIWLFSNQIQMSELKHSYCSQFKCYYSKYNHICSMQSSALHSYM